jgi:hypothetical protein
MANNELIDLFNNQLMEFINDIIVIFPKDKEILVAKNSILALKSANPKIYKKIINFWYSNVVSKYREYIANGDIDFFLDNDFTLDAIKNDNPDVIIKSINHIKKIIGKMEQNDLQKSIEYLQNLQNIAIMYFEETSAGL